MLTHSMKTLSRSSMYKTVAMLPMGTVSLIFSLSLTFAPAITSSIIAMTSEKHTCIIIQQRNGSVKLHLCSNSCFRFVVAQELHDSCTESPIKTLLHNDLRIRTEHFSHFVQILSSFFGRCSKLHTAAELHQLQVEFLVDAYTNMETHEVAILIGHDRSEVSEVLTHLIEQILSHSERDRGEVYRNIYHTFTELYKNGGGVF